MVIVGPKSVYSFVETSFDERRFARQRL